MTKPKHCTEFVIFDIMTTLTIELTNEKALKLLKNLEDLQLIRVVKKEPIKLSELRNKIKKPMDSDAINAQFKELRNQWHI